VADVDVFQRAVAPDELDSESGSKRVGIEAADDVGFDRAVLGNGSGRSVDASGGPLFPRVDAPPA